MNWPLRLLPFAAAAALLLVAAHGVQVQATAGATATSSAGAAAAAAAAIMPMLRRVEEDVMAMRSFTQAGEDEAAAYPQRRMLQGGGYLGYNGLRENKAACYGPCPARGQPYKPGCQQIYQCRG